MKMPFDVRPIEVTRLAAGLSLLLAAAPAYAQNFTTTQVGTGTKGTITPVAGVAGAFSATGGGSDISGSLDNFTFHSVGARIAFDWRVRIASITPNDNDTKAGLMVRETLDPVSRMALSRATPFGPTINQLTGDNDVAFQYRNAAQAPAGGCGLFKFAASPFPNDWVRLERHGDILQGYRSSDGVNWLLLCEQDTAKWPAGRLTDTFQIGFAISPGVQASRQVAQAEFRDLSTSTPYPPVISQIPDQIIDEDTSTAALTFAIGDRDTDATLLTVSRSSSNTTLLPLSGITVVNTPTARTVKVTPAPGLSGDGDVTVTVSDGTRTASSSFHVRVNAVVDPPFLETPPQGVTVLAGNPLTLSVKVTGDAPFQYQWRKNKQAVANGDGPTFRIPAVQATDAGDYDVVVSNSAGSITTPPATVNVIELDYGDAPDPKYPTLKASNGASHRILTGFSLGDRVDGELDGQPNAAASGDGVEDDGVSFGAALVQGQASSITVTLRLPAGVTAGKVDGWIDWNADGDWLDAGEHIVDAFQAAGPKTYAINVAAAAIVGTTFARFRLSQDGKLEAAGASTQFGEVEDYAIQVSSPAPNLDFGDAPEKYPTLLTNDGARHLVNSDFKLGSRIDAEKDGQPDPVAKGDDATPANGGDEDGVTFLSPLSPGLSANIQVVVSSTGRLSAWFDWNGNGSWSDPGEAMLIGNVVAAGTNLVSIAVPSSAAVGTTFARFRYSRQILTTPTGIAPDGEVEDYLVRIERPLDFGDAPDSYRTTLKSDGARHIPVQGFTLGKTVDAEADGQPSPGASGDGTDEDGVIITGTLNAGTTERMDVVTSTKGVIDAWIDFNADGDFGDPGERIISGQAVPGGLFTLQVPIPTDAKSGASFARFRFSRQGVKDYFGDGGEGEVEDYIVRIASAQLDFGDAPEVIPGAAGSLTTDFPTTLKRDGARHLVRKGFTLGRTIDGEPDGQPTPTANGDDLVPSQADDEDGVTFLDPLVPGEVAVVRVIAPNGGFLDAWIDFDGNRSWAEPNNRIFNAQPLSLPVNDLAFLVPATAKPGAATARFRLSEKGGLDFKGYGGPGEVEDYLATIVKDRDRCDLSCMGREFWLTFPGNYSPDPANPVKPQLCIVGNKGTAITITIAGLGYLNNFVMPANSVNVTLPKGADLGDLNDKTVNKGVHVVASEPVGVYGLSQVQYTSDGYMGLPTEVLGTQYIVVGYSNVHTGVPELNGSQFAVVATQPNTTLKITPSFVTPPHDSGFAYSLVLTNAGDVYQLRNTNDAPADLTGTLVQADQPIAVFGGHQVANVRSSDAFFADYLVEQLPPVRRWGREFFPVRSAGRLKGDTFRVVASADGTDVLVDGVLVTSLNRGQFYESVIAGFASHIKTSKRSLVMQYANSSDYDGVTKSDPFMVQVPPRPYYSKEHIFCTAPAGFDAHHITVVVPSAAKSSVKLDGVAIAVPFVDIGSSGYAYGQKEISAGRHVLTADQAAGVTVYGWSQYESYAWPACLFFGDTTPPQLVNCPTNDIVVTLTGSDIAGANVSCRTAVPDLRKGVTVTDNCGLPATSVGTGVFQDPLPGSLVGVGTNVITLWAVDAAGNIGECQVNLIVKDPNPDGQLTFECPADFTVKCNTTNGAVVTYRILALQGCTPVNVVCDPPSGSLFQPGVTAVLCKLKQEGLPTLECSFKVTVDCQKPPRTLKVNLVQSQVELKSLKFEWDDDNADQVVVEVADSILGPWSEVPEARSGYTVAITTGVPGKYYRLKER